MVFNLLGELEIEDVHQIELIKKTKELAQTFLCLSGWNQ